jgi:hypothetical protein
MFWPRPTIWIGATRTVFSGSLAPLSLIHARYLQLVSFVIAHVYERECRLLYGLKLGFGLDKHALHRDLDVKTG